MAAEKQMLMDGLVHAVSPIGGGEHTLCGVAFDAADSEGDESLRWLGPSRRAVDCPMCCAVIRECRNMSTGDTQ